jgi:hypothetical protein
LEVAVRYIAVAAMLLRRWPRKAGGRHELAMRVGGFLTRAGFSAEDIDRSVDAVATEADDEEVADRRRAAADSRAAFEGGKHAYGLPALQAALGEGVANAIAKIVGYGEHDRDVPVIKVKAGDLPAVATTSEKRKQCPNCTASGQSRSTSHRPPDFGPSCTPMFWSRPLKYCVTFSGVIVTSCQSRVLGPFEPCGIGTGFQPRLM